MTYTGEMVEGLIEQVDETIYQKYRTARLQNPQFPISHWAEVFGVNVEAYEKRYDREMSAEMSYDEWMGGQL